MALSGSARDLRHGLLGDRRDYMRPDSSIFEIGEITSGVVKFPFGPQIGQGVPAASCTRPAHKSLLEAKQPHPLWPSQPGKRGPSDLKLLC